MSKSFDHEKAKQETKEVFTQYQGLEFDVLSGIFKGEKDFTTSITAYNYNPEKYPPNCCLSDADYKAVENYGFQYLVDVLNEFAPQIRKRLLEVIEERHPNVP